jgi:cysteine-rich secretory family protein
MAMRPGAASASRLSFARVAAPRPLVAVLLLALFAASLFYAETGPPLGGDPVLGGRDSRCWRVKRTERKFSRKINKARRGSNMRKLSLDPELSKVARKHAKEMARRNLLHHTPQSKLARRVTRWSYLGENVGMGGAVGSLHRAFMNSAPHRHNILRSAYKHSGVGVVKKRGRMWVTVIFEERRDPGTRLRMPRC